MTKSKKYLCRLECRNNRRDGTPLTHVKYFTVSNGDIEHAHNIALAAQRDFTLEIAARGQHYDNSTKTWTPGEAVGGEPIVTQKRHKLSYRWRPYVATGDAAKAEDERRAIAYVEWLAKRDGVSLPTIGDKKQRRVIWGGFYSEHRTRNVHSYSGTRPQHAYIRRIEAVEWGYDEDIYNMRKDGKRGAWLRKEWCPVFRVELPNWNFDPVEPIDGIDAAPQTDLASVSYASCLTRSEAA